MRLTCASLTPLEASLCLADASRGLPMLQWCPQGIPVPRRRSLSSPEGFCALPEVAETFWSLAEAQGVFLKPRWVLLRPPESCRGHLKTYRDLLFPPESSTVCNESFLARLGNTWSDLVLFYCWLGCFSCWKLVFCIWYGCLCLLLIIKLVIIWFIDCLLVVYWFPNWLRCRTLRVPPPLWSLYCCWEVWSQDYFWGLQWS